MSNYLGFILIYKTKLDCKENKHPIPPEIRTIQKRYKSRITKVDPVCAEVYNELHAGGDIPAPACIYSCCVPNLRSFFSLGVLHAPTEWAISPVSIKIERQG